MELIDKDALVAEIKRISCENPMDNSWYVDTEELLNFINTLEVKLEVEEEPVSEDLENYINELSKQFPEVSFAKLSRIAIRVSRWQRNQDVKNKLPKVISRTDLDEYAYQCAYDMSNDWAIDNPTWHDVEDACKLGAKWQEKQDQARRAVEIAREEELEYVKYQLELRLPETLDYNGVQVDREDFINDFIKAMKDE